MKKLITFFLCISILSCDDGDLDIPAFDFEKIVYGCEIKDNNYTLFRLGIAETIIVTLSKTDLKEQETEDPIKVPITAENVIYRTFSDQISQDYFCKDVPPIEPRILSNWTGVSGNDNNIIIVTVKVFDSKNNITGYKHTITFENLKVQKDDLYLAFEEGVFGDYIIDL